MSGLDPAKIAAADQAMRDATLDLNDNLTRVREYLATGHDPAEAFLNLLSNFKAFLDADRPELVAGTAAAAILRLAGEPS